MEILEYINQLKELKRTNNELFNSTMNKLKISNPEIYERIKVHFEESETFSSEEPFEIKLPESKPRAFNWSVLFIILFVLLFAGAGGYFYLQSPGAFDAFFSSIFPEPASNETSSGEPSLSLSVLCLSPDRVVATIQNTGTEGASFSIMEIIDSGITIAEQIYSDNNGIQPGGAIISEAFSITMAVGDEYTIRVTTTEGVLQSDCTAE